MESTVKLEHRSKAPIVNI